MTIGRSALRLDASTTQAKQATFDRLHDWLRALPGEHDLQREITALCAKYGVDLAALCLAQCMSWDELKALRDEPLLTIGAHTLVPLQSRQAERGDRHAGDDGEPHADRAGARPPCAASCLSLW